MSASFSPGRPPSERDWLAFINGDPGVPLGVLTSTGTTAPVNNVTTATPFNTGNLQPDGSSRTLAGSLAGRVLGLQAISTGLFQTSDSPLIGVQAIMTVALQSVIPPAAFTAPGMLLTAGTTIVVTMLPTRGWLQWLSSAGTASLIIWELT